MNVKKTLKTISALTIVEIIINVVIVTLNLAAPFYIAINLAFESYDLTAVILPMIFVWLIKIIIPLIFQVRILEQNFRYIKGKKTDAKIKNPSALLLVYNVLIVIQYVASMFWGEFAFDTLVIIWLVAYIALAAISITRSLLITKIKF